MESMIINANQISIDFKDADHIKKFGVPVQNATEGSVSHMGIDYTRDCTVQKDMENSIVYTDAVNSKNQIVNEAAQNLADYEFDPADFISRSMTGEDAMEAEEDGTILEEYVAGTLDRVIEQIKGQRHDQEAALEHQVQDVEEEREYFEEVERRVVEALQMAACVQDLSGASVKYLLDNELPLTPENINHCSTVSNVSTYIPERADFEQMKPQIEAIIENSGMPADEGHLDTAKWLYENDVAVTEKTIQDYEMLQELDDMPPEVLYDRIVDEVIGGIKPEAADLTVPSRGEVWDRLKKLKNADEDALRMVYRTEADFITAKRQMEEIRLSMTLDAARTMESKGIHLDVRNLFEIVDELKAMEREMAEKVLAEAGLPANERNTDIMAKTLRAGRDILQAPVAVFGTTIATADRDTIVDVAAAGNDMRNRQIAAESYEAVGTEVRRDLGDSIRKAFSNVDDILEDLEIPATAANERAVRILAYNQMPLTKENIISMKEYDDKVTTLTADLKPAVVAELIRRQENPLEMNLDELSEKVSRIVKEVTADDIPFRKYIWKLDHHGDVAPEERKSMIGIYRLLDKVEKSDGAVIGQVVKEGRELSLSSLLSAVRSQKAQGIDKTVDDDFGGLEEIVTKAESISDQIGAAFGGNVVTKLKKELSPTVLKERKDTILTEPLEVILDECVADEDAAQEEAAYYEERAAEIRRMAAEGDAQLIRYLKEMDMPDSLVNIHLMKNFLEQGGRAFLKFYTKEESEKIVEAFDDPEELAAVYEELDGIHGEKLEEQKKQPDIHFDEVRNIARMASSISFYSQMRKFQKYEVPIVTEHGVTACSVTVKHGSEAEKGTVEIAVDSVCFNSVQATFKVSGNRVSGFVTSEDDQALRTSEEIMKAFEKDLEMNGFTMDRGNYALGRRNSFHLGDKSDETVTNGRLYQIAKLFIRNVQRKEEAE